MEIVKSRKRPIKSFEDKDDFIANNAKIIKNWQPRSDVWPFTYGVGALAAATVASSAYLNSYYRRAMKLGSRGLLISLFPNLVLPSLFATVTHLAFVSPDILVGPMQCWTCLEIKAASLQLTMAVGQATLMTSMLSYFMAGVYLTEVVPTIKQMPAHWWSMSQTLIRRRLPVIVVGHLLVVSVLTHQEMRASIRINEKIRAFDTQAAETLKDHALPIEN